MSKKTQELIDSKASTALASSTVAGLMPILPADTTKYLGGDLAWHIIAGGGDMTKAVYDPDLDSKIAEAQLTLNYATHSPTNDHVDNAGTQIATHAALTTGAHSLGTMALAASANYAATSVYAAHTVLVSSAHGAQYVVAAVTTNNTSTALTDIVGMVFAAATASVYVIEGFVVWNVSSTAVGIKLTATGPTNSAIMAGHFIADAANGTPDSSSFNTDNIVVTTSASPFAAGNLAALQGILKTAGTAGNFQLRCASETTGTVQVQPGSVLRWTKVE